MKDANISQVNNDNANQSNSLITADDLINSIGKLYVERLNDAKVFQVNYEGFNKQFSETFNENKELKEKIEKDAELLGKAEILHESNKLYQKNNRDLDVALTTERKKNEELRTKLIEVNLEHRNKVAELELEYKTKLKELKKSNKK